MKHEVSRQGIAVILHFEGSIDTTNYRELATILGEHIAAGDLHLVLDFQGVDLIDSSGISGIVNHIQALKAKNGKLVIARCSSNIRRVFQIIGFHRFFPIVDTLEEAVKA